MFRGNNTYSIEAFKDDSWDPKLSCEQKASDGVYFRVIETCGWQIFCCVSVRPRLTNWKFGRDKFCGEFWNGETNFVSPVCPDLKASTSSQTFLVTLCKSRTSNYWNHSSEIDTLVNQGDHAAPIRSPVRGRTGFSKSRGLRASVPFFPPSFHLFALAPFFARPECEKLLRVARISFASYGNACYAG